MNVLTKLAIALLFSTNLFSFSLFSFFSSDISQNNLLAVSWQENFCKLNGYKKECKRFRRRDFGWNNFVLHGLWPQPRSKQNCSNKFEKIDKQTFQKLKIAMPSVISGLHKHEWRKHGSCYGTSEKEYFNDAMGLLKQVNNSPIRDFFLRNRGRIITKQSLNMVIKNSLGNVARKIQMVCKRGLITELRFSLKGDARRDSLKTLLKNAKPFRGGCQKGKI